MIDLTSFSSLATALFVKIDVPDYTPGPLLFSDFDRPYTISGDTYDALGTLMSATTSANELRAVPGEITITVSGIPNSRLQEIVNTRIKGSNVTILRGFFNAKTGANLAIPGNPGGSNIVTRFQGRVMSIAIQEDWDAAGRSSTITAQFMCASEVALLGNKVTGRKTNPVDWQALNPTDTSMSDVPQLANSNFNWGAPQ
jgi:hypothetical protein